MEKKRSTPCAAGLLAAAVVAAAVTSSAAGEMGGTSSRRRHLAVPAMYVFGDSLVDVGNNDFLPAPAPRTEPPCGLDLPPGVAAGGRFTNGYNLADIIAQRVGLEMSPPAYLSLRPRRRRVDGELRRGRVGASYASGGSGILDTTGNGTLTLRKQVQFFADTKASMSISGEVADHLLSQSLFVACAGNNDFAGILTTTEPPAAYIAGMVATYVVHIKALYELGARRLAILDALPIGCVPASRVPMGDGACDDAENSLARRFNRLLRAEMAGAARNAMPELAYSVGSVYGVFSDMVADPLVVGMREAASACCGGGRLNAEAGCSASSNLCAERGEYVFWDMVHGTQAAYRRCAAAFFDGSARYAEPIDFEQLIPLAVDDPDRPRVNRTAEM